MQISFLMPTYNDADSIMETIDSLLAQTYMDWELIIVDDGSTDNLKDTLKPFLKSDKSKIKYIYQENQDQLNALLNGAQYINGEYVFILHSDDLLPDHLFLERAMRLITEYPDGQCFTGSLQLIGKNGQVSGNRKIEMYGAKEEACVKFLLHLGRNLISDFAFFERDFFANQVKDNYLQWNTPYWLPVDRNSDVAKNYDLHMPILKYRVYDNNYLNSELGILNVLNGELRAAAKIMQWYDIPFFELQFGIFNVLNRIGLGKIYKPIYSRKEMKAKAKYVKYILWFRLGSTYKDNEYFNSIYEFFRNSSKRELHVDSIPPDMPIYQGKDMKLFNKSLISKTLDSFYYQFMKEMRTGFRSITLPQADADKMEDVLRFFSIYGHVDIYFKKEL